MKKTVEQQYRYRALSLLKRIRFLRRETTYERVQRIRTEQNNNYLRNALEEALLEIKNIYCENNGQIDETVISKLKAIRNIAEGKSKK